MDRPPASGESTYIAGIDPDEDAYLVRQAEAESDALAAQESDMCPNCVTPWKCNGPHRPPVSGEPRTDDPFDSLAHWITFELWDAGHFTTDHEPHDPGFPAAKKIIFSMLHAYRVRTETARLAEQEGEGE